MNITLTSWSSSSDTGSSSSSSIVNLYNLGDNLQVNEQPEIKIKLFKEIGDHIETMFDGYLQDGYGREWWSRRFRDFLLQVVMILS